MPRRLYTTPKRHQYSSGKNSPRAYNKWATRETNMIDVWWTKYPKVNSDLNSGILTTKWGSKLIPTLYLAFLMELMHNMERLQMS